MKKIFFAVITTMASTFAFAQVDSTAQTPATDTTSQATINSDTTSTQAAATSDTAAITDEDLKKYAEVMDSINTLKQNLLAEITAMVKGNTKLTMTRYNELSKAGNDEEKLKTLKATPEEVAFIKQVADKKSEGATKIGETFQSLAKDYIGVEVYNKIKESLASDTALKTRYDQILSEVQSEGTASNKK